MFDESKKLINDEELSAVAGGQTVTNSYYTPKIAHCPECGQEVTLPFFGDLQGFGIFMTCPHCNKNITFQF